MREQALLAGTPERDGVPGLKELGRERSRTIGNRCLAYSSGGVDSRRS